MSKLLALFLTSKVCSKTLISLRNCSQKLHNSTFQGRILSAGMVRSIETTHHSLDEELGTADFTISTIDNGYARDLLYKDNKDHVLRDIYECASVEQLLNVVERNIGWYSCAHITQTVLVLYDLSNIYNDFISTRKQGDSFLKMLQEEVSFQKLMGLIERKIDDFDHKTLSYCVLYLKELGLNLEANVVQLMCDSLKNKLLQNFCLSSVSRFLYTVFQENNLRSYFMSQDLIPGIFEEIDNCSSPESLRSLSICLNTLHNIITDESLCRYKSKVETLVKNGIVASCHFKAVLQVIAFLNYPKWREKNARLISQCIILIQDNINKMSISEILLLYEVFQKLEEPGSVLNSIQHCTYKHYNQLEDTPTEDKIRLFSTIIFFTTPHLRNELTDKLKIYVKECEDYSNLLLLRKVLSYMKISDANLCNLYWNKMLRFLRTDKEDLDVMQLSVNYMSFCADTEHYRHTELESELLKILKEMSEEPSCKHFPSKFVRIVNFALLYSEDAILLNSLITKLEENCEQLQPLDCLRLSFTLKMFEKMEVKYGKMPYARRVHNVIDRIIQNGMVRNLPLSESTIFLKSCVYKNKTDVNLMNKIIQNYSVSDELTSKNIEHIYHCLLMTNTLNSSVLDNIVNYVVEYNSNLLGFNVARTLYLCYSLGYHPKNIDNFCKAATDTIIRDHKRMTGLSVINSALSLCFFNQLPVSLMKSIFNAEFMDRLDDELQQCYSKDKYPKRVREQLMQLNRAVCLDYPECNVPWFHQKYVDEVNRDKNQRPILFGAKVKECLTKIVQNQNCLFQNVVTPYGYTIDFVVKLNSDDEIVDNDSKCAKRFALLLIPEFAYTRIQSQLKGSFQLKKRHLEMMGYKVVFIRFSDWHRLFYAEDRILFLERLIWPRRCSEENIQTIS